MRVDVLTIFPHMFESPLKESILKRAQEKSILSVVLHDIRDFTDDPHRTVDDRPFGGGPGMVMMPEPVFAAVEDVRKTNKGPLIYLTPHGERLSHSKALALSQKSEFILLCGRYEGIDQRIRDSLVDEELSIGDYVLSGGELPALVVIDAVTRLITGVLGDDASKEEESFSELLGGKKEYPQYTRPATFRGMDVPEILLSGDHAKIKQWRHEQLS